MAAQVQRALTCACRPGFVYKPASFQTHFKSQRHQTWSTVEDLRDCRIRIVRLEQENLRLTRVVDRLVMQEPRAATTRSVTAGQKKKIAAVQHWTCGRCAGLLDAAYQVDHIVPLFKGGGNDADNLMALCNECHGDKTWREQAVGHSSG